MSSANVHETVAVRFVSLRVCLISAPLRLGHPLPLVPAQVSSHRLSPNLFSPLHLLLNIQNRSPLMKVLSTVSYQADKTNYLHLYLICPFLSCNERCRPHLLSEVPSSSCARTPSQSPPEGEAQALP